MIDVRKKILLLAVILFMIVFAGAAGYMIIENYSVTDAMFMTVITMSTVGYGAVAPLSGAGKVFTMFLNVGGIALYSYAFFSLISIVSTGSIQKMFRRSKMDSAIDRIKGHYIICGSGEIGKHIAAELFSVSREVVVIEESEEALRKSGMEGFLHVIGEADDETVLEKAGIGRAEGIFCARHDDRANILITLSARDMNRKIRIVSICVSADSHTKFIKAGSDRVIFSEKIGGMRMASEMIRPGVVSFLDEMLRRDGGTRFEEVSVTENSPLAGRNIGEGLPEKFDISIVAVRGVSGDYVYNCLGKTEETISPGEKIIVIGKASEVEKFRKYAES